MATTSDPKWWADEHTSTWDRIKAAFRRDWEQTKNDVSDSKGRDLNQNDGDTIKQAAGSQPIPPASQPTHPGQPAGSGLDDWERHEAGHRYGYGAQRYHGKEHGADWNDRVESKLKEEWTDLKTGQTWDDTKAAVRRGWDRAKSIKD